MGVVIRPSTRSTLLSHSKFESIRTPNSPMNASRVDIFLRTLSLTLLEGIIRNMFSTIFVLMLLKFMGTRALFTSYTTNVDVGTYPMLPSTANPEYRFTGTFSGDPTLIMAIRALMALSLEYTASNIPSIFLIMCLYIASYDTSMAITTGGKLYLGIFTNPLVLFYLNYTPKLVVRAFSNDIELYYARVFNVSQRSLM